jgi:hypothetical protein
MGERFENAYAIPAHKHAENRQGKAGKKTPKDCFFDGFHSNPKAALRPAGLFYER